MKDSKKTRALKRDARLERRYGNPLMRKIADNDPSVATYYRWWRAKQQEQRWDYIVSAAFLGLALLEIIILLFSEEKDISFGSTVCVFWGMYFLLCARMCDIEADRVLDKFTTWASTEAKEKALKDYCGIKKEKK